MVVGGGHGVAELKEGLHRQMQPGVAPQEILLPQIGRKILHDDEEQAVDAAEVEDANDVRMVELGQGPGLAVEALGEGGVRAHRCGQHLDGDLPVQRGLLGQPDFAHAAAADQVAELVIGQPAVEQGFQVVDALGLLRHVRLRGAEADSEQAGGAKTFGRVGRQCTATAGAWGSHDKLLGRRFRASWQQGLSVRLWPILECGSGFASAAFVSPFGFGVFFWSAAVLCSAAFVFLVSPGLSVE